MRIFILLLLLASLASAQEFYADVSADIKEDGFIVFSGVTNHPSLQGTSQVFTSKNKAFWLLNLSVPDDFETYVLEVELPAYAGLNYVQGKGVTIQSDGGSVVITQIGSGPISLVAQYQLKKQQRAVDLVFTMLSSVLVIAAFWFIMVFAYRRGRKRSEKQLPEYIKGLPSRQREIVEMLHSAGGQLTQKQIEQRMAIPKSSVSRNIDGLARKGIIEKQSLGISNIIRRK
jgi:uncharacterized membrane protein